MNSPRRPCRSRRSDGSATVSREASLPSSRDPAAVIRPLAFCAALWPLALLAQDPTLVAPTDPLSPEEQRQKFKIDAGLEGAVVTEVDPNGPAAEKRIEPGDVITLRYKLSEALAVKTQRGPEDTRAGVEYRIEK